MGIELNQMIYYELLQHYTGFADEQDVNKYRNMGLLRLRSD